MADNLLFDKAPADRILPGPWY